jgi:hypothetical protein
MALDSPHVMPALVAGILDFLLVSKAWMAGTEPGHDDVASHCRAS